MRLKRKELKTLIESLLLEGEAWYTKFEDTEFGKAAKQIFNTPDGAMETYVFPDSEGKAPEEFKTPDGPKYYYGSGDNMKEATVSSEGPQTFVYHPENKPAGIELSNETL